MERRRQQLVADNRGPVRAAAKSAVAELPLDAAGHPELRSPKRRGLRCGPAGWVEPRRLLRLAEIRTAIAVRLSGTDGRCDLVDAGAGHAEFSGRELRRVLQKSP